MRKLGRVSRRLLAIILYLSAFGLIAIAFYFQISNNYLESRFAKGDSVTFNDVVLKITYPSRLQVEPIGTVGRPMIMQLNYDERNDQRIRVVINASTSNYLIFTDGDGRIVSSVVTLGRGTMPSSAVFYLQPTPLQDGLPQSATLEATVIATIDGSKYTSKIGPHPISIENSSGSIYRFLVTPLAQNVVIFLSLSIALVGWGIDYHKRQQDQDARVQKELIELLRSLVETEPLEALRQIPEYERQAKDEQWDNAFRRQLSALRYRVSKNDYLVHTLHGTSEAIRRGDKISSDPLSILKIITPYFENATQSERRFLGNVLVAIEDFWEIFNDPSLRRLLFQLRCRYKDFKLYLNTIHYSLNHLCKEYYGFTRELVYTSMLQFLESYPKHQSEIVDLLHRFHYGRRILDPQGSYKWVIPEFSFTQSDQEDISNWLKLERNLLEQNPFSIPDYNSFVLAYLVAEQWDAITNLNSPPTIIYSEFAKDCDAASLILLHQIQTPDDRRNYSAFPFLIKPDQVSTVLDHSPLLLVAQSYLDHWLTFLCHNIKSFFDLSKPEQNFLGEALLWRLGSLAAFDRWLYRQKLTHLKDAQVIRAYLNEASSRRPPGKEPSLDEVQIWLNIRPSGLNISCVIINCSELAKDETNELVDNILKQTAPLRVVSIRIFTSTAQLQRATTKLVHLAWSSEYLVNALKRCMQQASRVPDIEFSDLFGPKGFPSADDLLVKAAKGSFNRLLELGNKVIEKHVERDLQNPYLNEDDLLDVLRENGSI